MAKNCKIVRVASVDPIPGKDRIRFASFDGTSWRVIVGLDIQVGDLVLFVEYDQLIPEETAALLNGDFYPTFRERTYSGKYEACRIKATKMGDKTSYGIVFTLADLKRFTDAKRIQRDWQLGDDLRDILRISDVPDDIPNSGNLGIYWPSCIPSTDETRYQNLGYLTSDPQFLGMEAEETEKANGRSVTFALVGEEFYYGYRNMISGKMALGEARVAMDTAAFKIRGELEELCVRRKLLPLLEYLRAQAAPESRDLILVQGELCGPKIQKNELGLAQNEIKIFNMRFGMEDWRSWKSIHELLAGSALYEDGDFPQVKLLRVGAYAYKTAEDLEKAARGFYASGKAREGIVIRFPQEWNGDFVRSACEGMHNMMSFKVINPEHAMFWRDPKS